MDKIFDGSTGQEDIYKGISIGTLTDKVTQGFNATIFAYGQTGSGKTHTMEGYKYYLPKRGTGMNTPIAKVPEYSEYKVRA